MDRFGIAGGSEGGTISAYEENIAEA